MIAAIPIMIGRARNMTTDGTSDEVVLSVARIASIQDMLFLLSSNFYVLL